MNFTLENKVDGKTLIAAVVGELDVQAYLSMRSMVNDAFKQANTQNVLLDLRRVVVRVSFMDIFGAASTNIELFKPSNKYAIVYSEETLPEADAKFGETVARNRGSNFRVFKDMSLAKEWLIEP